MRGRGNKHAPKQVSAHYNHVAAFAKVGTAPLERLDDRMIESIAAAISPVQSGWPCPVAAW